MLEHKLQFEKNLKNLSESEFFIRNTKATSLKLITKEDLFDNNLESTEETLKAVLKDQEFDITYRNKISNKDLENFINENSIGTIFYPVEESISKSKMDILILSILEILKKVLKKICNLHIVTGTYFNILLDHLSEDKWC